MKDSVILEGKIYISAKRAAKIINYAQDYIGQLCRSGKLDCKMIGRSWFVTEESLLAHRADAIDATQERVLKVIKNNDVAIKETIKASVEEKKIIVPVTVSSAVSVPAVENKSVISPIQATDLTYEAENISLLPELKKKVPEVFAMKNVMSLTPAPFVVPMKKITVKKSGGSAPARITAPMATPLFAQSGGTAALQMANPVSTTLIITLVALGAFFFTLSFVSFENSRAFSRNDASVSSAAGELVSEILKAIGLKGRSPTIAAAPRENVSNQAVSNDNASTTPGFNGIGIFPSSSPQADEEAKQRIMNSFSDEVTIQPDKSGTSGVITPVFKQTDGKDFVYVLVPVKEKKQ
jgi:hypothetical protein